MSGTRPRAVVVGPPGSGKSTVGRLLAEQLGVGFRDTDEDVEAAAGCTIGELFTDRGEEHFREMETAALGAALAEHDGVLSLGGGSVLREENRKALSGHTVVYLEVDAAEAAARVGLNTARPLLLGNVRGQLNQLLQQRRPLYEQVAVITVDTVGRTPEEVAALIAGELA